MIAAITDRWRRIREAIRAASRIAESEEEQRYKPIDWSLLKRMIRTLKPYWPRYLAGLMLGICMIVLELQGPRFMQSIINLITMYTSQHAGEGATTATAASAAPAFVQRIASTMGYGSVVQERDAAVAAVVIIVAIWALALGLALVLRRYLILMLTGAGERVQFGLRRAIFEQLQRLSMSYYDKTKLGRIISRCTSDISSMREVNVWGIHHVVANALMILGAAYMLFITERRLFLAVVWLAPVLAFCNHLFRKHAVLLHQVTREGWTRVSTNLAENITGVRVVTAFNRQLSNLGVFNTLQEVNTANNVNVARVNGVYQPLLLFIGFVGKIIILSYGGYLVITGKIPKEKGAGVVVAAFLFWEWFMNPILTFGTFYNQLLAAMAGAERVFGLLDMKPEVCDVPDARALPRIQGKVTFENVTFGYYPDRPVLHDVSFQAVAGQTVALVGATGSGKSSIISLVARFYQPQRGRILMDGNDIRHITAESLHKQMGLVLQVNYLFSGSVKENIRYARPEATDQEIIDAAKAIGSYESIMALKEGFETEVGERGASMSLGQRQLICFTRAFLADPRIFMLDEATSSVDTATEMLIQSSLEKLLAGRTTFIVAHRLSTILRADLILVVEQGRIVERGTHRELLEAGGKYAALYAQFVHQAD